MEEVESDYMTLKISSNSQVLGDLGNLKKINKKRTRKVNVFRREQKVKHDLKYDGATCGPYATF